MITRILIIGAGVIAHEHAKAARKLKTPPRIVAADPSEAARAKFREAFPEAEVFASMEEMLALPREAGDVAIVATPPFLHRPQGLAALRSGRHTLVEKPLALNLAEAEELWAEAKARGVMLACCSSRFSARPLTAEVRRRIFSGDIGEGWRVRWQVRFSGGAPGLDYQPQSKWFLDKSKAGSGSLFDWGVYDVAMWTELFDPVKVSVDAAWFGYPRRGPQPGPGVVFDVEHHVVAHLRLHLADGRVVPLTFERGSMVHGGELNIVQVEGARGAFEWDWLDWAGSGRIRWMHERAPGEHVVDETDGPSDGLFCHDRPLHALEKRLAGEPAADVSGARAMFNFRILNAVGEVARTSKPAVVERSE